MAGEKDIQAVYTLVKAAYNIEMGDKGVSFKNANRYISAQSVLKDLPFIWVLRENEEMIGCIKGVVSHNGQIVEIGPVAVRPDKQVRKYENSYNHEASLIWVKASSKNLYAYHILGERIWKNNDRIRRKIGTNTTSWRCILQNRRDANVQRFGLLQLDK